MSNIERRLCKVEGKMIPTTTEHVVGHSQAEIDRKVARLREAGFTGEIEETLIQLIIVSPPPMDRDGNIIGPAPEPYVWEPTEARQ